MNENLESEGNQHPPGTYYLIEQAADEEIIQQSKKQKKKGNIILHPQPSSDPNDPLNWTRLRKEYHFALVWLWSFFMAMSIHYNGPLFGVMIEYYHTTLNEFNITQGFGYLFLAVGCVVLQPLALKYGRRPVYMIGTILNIIANIEIGAGKELGALYAQQTLSGLGAAPVDSLVQISITDIFFLHEHGTRLAVYILSLYAGSYLGPVISGYIYQGMNDWKWVAWWLLIISVIFLTVQVFTLDETTYKRKPLEDNDEDSDEKKQESNEDIIENTSPEESTTVTETQSLHSYKHRMRLVHYEQGSDLPLWKLFWLPFPTVKFPAVAWSSFVYGVQIAWLSLLTITQSEFFSAEPYNFGETTVGLINFGSLIGSIAGTIYGSWTDVFQLWMTRRNNGIFEPEFRLWTLTVGGLVNTAGLLMYGLGVKHGIMWVFPVFGLGLVSFGISACGAVAITYSVDCYPEITGYTMVIILFIRNLVGMLFTYVFQYWLDGMGLQNTTIFLAVICLVSNYSFLIFTKWGKKWRIKTAESYYALSTLKT